ncbi:hypothetical protein AB205_0055330 [Aquarana catesbeiana]|uniref:tRNA (uracil-O(2)-)-methyltransferase n=1 Tax=Aquarana catesbeiana TaxID=8400 RepID=A0A2G9RYR7_AQUCT|nr:hypothetical protein AB205_0055330 [Aquarana catesbeiana]
MHAMPIVTTGGCQEHIPCHADVGLSVLTLHSVSSWLQVWPEVTDPEKFVYEDVAISTYLLVSRYVLWEEERFVNNSKKKQSFIDLGCGNGLLVHILSNEGECAITPSDEHLFPDADWIIGNHSDELTPWLPVIAAR